MKEIINRLQDLLQQGINSIQNTTEDELNRKHQPNKWSKKEIVGHLIDSAINNLQRFTEIQFESQPYKIRKYKQAELVTANNYQNSDTKELLALWDSLNKRIMFIMEQQTDETLKFVIDLDDEVKSDLHFLMVDYVDHFEHHINQIC